jgi:putative ABC transport system permease protein
VTGRLLLVTRLLLRDLGRRRAETVLLVFAIAAATATLTLGRTMNEIAERPYERTRAATAGPDLVLEPGGAGPEALRALEPLAREKGVTAHSGPFPLVFTALTVRDTTVRVVVEGRDGAPAAVDRPAVTDGTWVRPGGVVVEGGFADAFDLHTGDTVTIGGRQLRVTGIAASAARSVYPWVGWHEPWDIATNSGGLVWADRGDIDALAGGKPLSYVLKLKLAYPGGAEAFFHQPHIHPNLRGWHVRTGDSIAKANQRLNASAQTALTVGSWLLTVLAVAGVAGIVAGRIAGRRRRVGLLKAVGAGPAMVAAVHLAEYLVIGSVAAGAGLALGWVAAPALFGPSAGLVGSVGARPPADTIVAAIVLALGIAGIATLRPVIRAATTSTDDALADAATPPCRRGLHVWISRRLPTALLIGVRINARRPRRARLVTVNVFITTTALAAVFMEIAQDHQGIRLGYTELPDIRDERTVRALFLVAGVIVLLAILNTLVTTWTAVLDARQPLAVARALGATPGQAGTGLAVAQLLPAVPGVVGGVLLGIGLYRVFAPATENRSLPASWIVVIGLGVLLAVAALTAVPALIAARRPIADALGPAPT